MKKQCKWIWYAVWLLICLVGGGGTLFSWMARTDARFYPGCAMLVLSAVLGVWFLLLAKSRPFKKVWFWGLVSGAVYAGVLALIVYLCDKVIFPNAVSDYQPIHSSLITVLLNFALIVGLCLAIPQKYDPKLAWLKRGVALVLCVVALCLSALPQNYWWKQWNFMHEVMDTERNAAPTGLSSFTEKEYGLVEDADLYVAVDGSDDNDGSFAHPFATIEKARDVIRTMDKTGRSGITVAIKAGEYRMESIIFTAEDSGTEECPITYCAYGDGEVILNAGVTLDPADFEVVSGAAADRIHQDAKGKVISIDLTKLGITLEQIGAVHAIGAYNTAYKYDGDYDGAPNCELFVNNTRQTTARWPNEEYLKTGTVLEHGQPWETVDAPNVKVEGWENLRNPRGDTYSLSRELVERISGWATLEDVWMYGYWSYDWAPGSTPIEAFDPEKGSITTKFTSIYGAHKGKPYYFLNVLEELDIPGEWYVDRTTGVLYLYEPENLAEAEIVLSLSTDSMITIDNANWLTFRGLTLQGSRGHGIEATGDNNTIEACLIRNISGTGIRMVGYNNLISSNEITRTGIGGIYIEGGDFETLTPGNNRIYNNHIHHWGELDGIHGIQVRGVGQLIDHNEMHDYIDVAVNYYGNNHIIEYNLIYNVSMETSDGGAIYCGRSWTMYGNVVRYNCIYNMGDPDFSYPNGIYCDDGLSGQQIYGNLIVNAPSDGIKLGGGHDNEIWGNIIINSESPIHGVGSLYETNIKDTLVPEFLNSYKDTPAWKEAYPILQELYWDDSRPADPYLVMHPARNQVNGNICVNADGFFGTVDENIANYSDFSGNAVYTLDMLDEIFVDPGNGDYRLKEDSVVYELIPEFEELPIEKMGRE